MRSVPPGQASGAARSASSPTKPKSRILQNQGAPTNPARSFLLASADLARQSNLCSIPAKVRALLNELNGALSID
jgi:hypothetical protein